MAATYYVAAAGSDGANGLSPATAWATLTKVNAHAFVPGDVVLFNGGNTFSGGIALTVSGTSANPITFGSYGTGVATIQSAAGTIGFSAINIAGVSIQNLNFTGPGIATANQDGIHFLVNTASIVLNYIRINNVNVTGYVNGIYIFSNATNAGYNDVRITNTNSFANSSNGIYVNYVGFTSPHSNFYVGFCTAYNNPGLASGLSGQGILLASVNNGTLEYSSAYGNGTTSVSGSVGLWTSNANNVIIQFCESYNNSSAGGADGDGFDIDGGSTNCIIQYCYSHGNLRGGFCLFEYTGAGTYANNIIRYNISENDGFGIELWGQDSSDILTNSAVYNNTIYGGAGPCLNILDTGGGVNLSGITITNNIFVTTGGQYFVVCPSGNIPGITFSHNDYFAISGAFQFNWRGTVYTTLSSWGQDTTGIVSNPGLVNPGHGGTVGNPANFPISLPGYRLAASSPMINAGAIVASPGSQDFYGDPLGPQILIDIGADQLLPPAGFFISAQITGVSWIGEPVWTVTAPWGFISRPNLMEALQQLVWKAGAQYGGRMQAYFSRGVLNSTEVGVP